ncbi:MAG: hypothetical protein ACLSFW_07550 [Bacteroides cellulosilyticus]
MKRSTGVVDDRQPRLSLRNEDGHLFRHLPLHLYFTMQQIVRPVKNASKWDTAHKRLGFLISRLDVSNTDSEVELNAMPAGTPRAMLNADSNIQKRAFA